MLTMFPKNRCTATLCDRMPLSSQEPGRLTHRVAERRTLSHFLISCPPSQRSPRLFLSSFFSGAREPDGAKLAGAEVRHSSPFIIPSCPSSFYPYPPSCVCVSSHHVVRELIVCCQIATFVSLLAPCLFSYPPLEPMRRTAFQLWLRYMTTCFGVGCRTSARVNLPRHATVERAKTSLCPCLTHAAD